MQDLLTRTRRLSTEQRAHLARLVDRHDGQGGASGAPDDQLVAYVVPKAGTKPSTSDLRTFMQGQVPRYLVPDAFAVLDALPRNANGKVDRRALPAPALLGDDEAEAPSLVLPRTPAETQLAALWSEALGTDLLGVHDDFFEVGGHSLLAIKLLGLIRDAFDDDLPMSALFEAPTIAGMAARLAGGSPADSVPRGDGAVADAEAAVPAGYGRPGPETPSLVPLRPTGTRPPLYCVHGIDSGILLGFASLARMLGTDQPVYGVKGGGRDGQPIPHATVEEMAAQYVDEISLFQPEGPLMLTGFCYGSLVALAMAHELRRRERDVALLILIDAENPAWEGARYGNASRGRIHDVPEWRQHLRRVHRDGLSYLGRKVRATVPQRLIDLRRRTAYAAAKLVQAAGRPLPRGLQGIYIHTTYRRIIQAYRPGRYDGPVVVLRSSSNQHPEPAMGWADVLGDVQAVEIDGSHYMLRDSLPVLAPRLSEAITAALHAA